MIFGKSEVFQVLVLLKQSGDSSRRLDCGGPLFAVPPEDFLFHGVGPGSELASIKSAGCRTVQSEVVSLYVRLQYSAAGALVGRKRGTISFNYGGQQFQPAAGHCNAQQRIEHGRDFVNYIDGSGVDLIHVPANPAGRGFGHFVQEASKVPSQLFSDLSIVQASRCFSRSNRL